MTKLRSAAILTLCLPITLGLALEGAANDPAKVNVEAVTGAKPSTEEYRTILVAPKPIASDDSAGQVRVETLAEAFRMAGGWLSDGVATRIAVAPGVYREWGVVLDGELLGKKAAETSLLIEGTEPMGTVWTGMVFIETWQPCGDDAYLVTQPTILGDNTMSDEGVVEHIPGTFGREAILVSYRGLRLERVSAPENLIPLSYCLERTKDGRRQIVFRVWKGVLQPGEIEVSGLAGGEALLQLRNLKNVTLRRIKFTGCGLRPWLAQAVSLQKCRNVLLEDLEFSENNSTGLGVFEINGLTVRRLRAFRNGASGAHGVAGRNQIFEDCDFSENGWRTTGLGGQSVWFDAGIKHGFGLRDAIFRRIECRSNESVGFWLDSDMENILMEQLTCRDNRRSGLWWEGSHGPGELRDSVIQGNWHHGILLGDAGGLTLVRNTISGNIPAQIGVGISLTESTGESGRMVTDSDTGKAYLSDARNVELRENDIAALEIGQVITAFEWGGIPGRSVFLQTLRSSGNRFWHPLRSNVFAGPVPRLMKDLNFDQWQELERGADVPPNQRSRWAPPEKRQRTGSR